jgi:tRNA-binding protein
VGSRKVFTNGIGDVVATVRRRNPDLYGMSNQTTITWQDFEKIDMRAGTIIEVTDFPKARKPAFRLRIDFGEAIGILQSSAQITKFYTKESLLHKQVIAVVNFPKKQIADFMSECLVLGLYDENNDVILLQPGQPITNGMKVG